LIIIHLKYYAYISTALVDRGHATRSTVISSKQAQLVGEGEGFGERGEENGKSRRGEVGG
jgi:hypothetical protein